MIKNLPDNKWELSQRIVLFKPNKFLYELNKNIKIEKLSLELPDMIHFYPIN